MPFDEKKNIFRYADDSDIPTETAHLGMVFPFSIELHSARVKNTMDSAWKVYQEAQKNVDSELVFSYNWIWAVGRLASICFYQGLADQGYAVLNQAVKTVGPFLTPNEHYRLEGGAFLPWFTTGSGAFVYAINAMFVQVYDEQGAIFFPAIPSKIQNAEINNLFTTHGVSISAKITAGEIKSLTAYSEKCIRWRFRIPELIAKSLKFKDIIKLSKPDELGLVTVDCKLQTGTNILL